MSAERLPLHTLVILANILAKVTDAPHLGPTLATCCEQANIDPNKVLPLLLEAAFNERAQTQRLSRAYEIMTEALGEHTRKTHQALFMLYAGVEGRPFVKLEPDAPSPYPHDLMERGGDVDCDHERVFSGERALMTNPGWHWICSACGRVGMRVFAPGCAPQVFDRAHADALLRKWT